MEVLLYILIFLSAGLTLTAVVETYSEFVRIRITGKNLRSLHSLLMSKEKIEIPYYQKMADSIVISDIKDSYELEETLEAIKKIELTNRTE